MTIYPERNSPEEARDPPVSGSPGIRPQVWLAPSCAMIRNPPSCSEGRAQTVLGRPCCASPLPVFVSLHP